jgi:hypothetical protein
LKLLNFFRVCWVCISFVSSNLELLLKVSRIDFIDSSNNFQMCDAITSQQIQSPGWSNLYTFLTLLWFSVNLMTHNGSSSWDCSHSWITQLLTTPRFAVYNLLQELGRDFLFQRSLSFSLFVGNLTIDNVYL